MFNIEEIKEELQLQICAGAPLLFQETDDYIDVAVSGSWKSSSSDSLMHDIQLRGAWPEAGG
jgi:hypothetical protein